MSADNQEIKCQDPIAWAMIIERDEQTAALSRQVGELKRGISNISSICMAAIEINDDLEYEKKAVDDQTLKNMWSNSF